MLKFRSSIIDSMLESSDEQLVASFRSDGGSPAGNRWLDELFSRYHSRVALWCYRFTGDQELASDLAQDIFLRAYRNIGSFRGDSKFSTWLFTIARNHCVNEMRARSVRPEHAASSAAEIDIEDVAKESVLHSLEREESIAVMRSFIEQNLDDVERKVVVLHLSEEIGLDAITRLLELKNPSGARAYMLSAKRKLSAAMQRWKSSEQKGGA